MHLNYVYLVVIFMGNVFHLLIVSVKLQVLPL